MANTVNNQVSLVVASQLPGFVQDDYATFVAFLQAYYEYLEQNGKLTWAHTQLESGFDVDDALDIFVEQFKQQYLKQFPADVLADKALLVKNIKQFYLAKGSEKSIKFLFRALFGEDIAIVYPNRSILRVSDGKWIKETALRITGNMLNLYTGNGNTNTYILTDTLNSKANLFITIDGAIVSPNLYSLSGRTLSLTSNVANGSALSVSLTGGDYSKFVGTQIFGSTSGASAIVDKYKNVFDKGQFYNELTISDLSKNFAVGENAYSFWVDDVNNISVEIAVPITSSVIDVEIVSGGTFYNVGDPLIFTSSTGFGAQAYVATIYKAGLRSIETVSPGAGFKPGVLFNVIGGGGSGGAVFLNGVDSSGAVHPNTYNVTSDIIQVYANTPLGSANYGFPAFANGNVNTLLSQAFTYQQYGLCGPIDPTQVLIIQEGQDYITLPTISLDSPIFTVNVAGNTANVAMTDFGILGALKIYNGGVGYAVGDEVIFTNVLSSTGQDAAAAVTAISATGGIAKIDFQYPRIPGTVNIIAGSNVVFGTNTSFANNVTANATIIVNNEIRVVQTVTNSNNIIVTSNWTNSATNKKLGVKGRNFIGGSGYHMGFLPVVTLSSAGGGSNANVIATAVIGDGESLQVSSLQPVGRIKSITVSQGGSGYLTTPNVDLSMHGDGTANVLAQIAGGMFSYPGVFSSEDGFVSGSNKLHDRDFYQFYSYVIKSKKTLDKYEQTLKQLVHPIGMKYFAEYDPDASLVDESGNLIMSHYDFSVDYKYMRILLGGSSLVTKKMNYVVLPGRFTVWGSNSFYKKKAPPVTGLIEKLGGSAHGGDAILSAPLMTNMFLDAGSGVLSFSRSDVVGSNATVIDFENVMKYALPGEIRFQGARRVLNIIGNSANIASWNKGFGGLGTAPTVSATPTEVAPDGTLTAYAVVCNLNGGATGTDSSSIQSALWNGRIPVTGEVTRRSVWLKTRDGSTANVLLLIGGAGANYVVQANGSWQRLASGVADNNINAFVVGLRGSFTSDSANLAVWHPQWESTPGPSNQNPSEYVSTGEFAFPYHGANVDGVKYFSNTNINVVTGRLVTATNNVIALSPAGFLQEDSTNNVIKNSSNLAAATFGRGGVDVTPGVASGSDGMPLSMCAVTTNTAGGSKALSYTHSSGSANVPYTFYFEVKPNNVNSFATGIFTNGTGFMVLYTINLASNTITLNQGTGTIRKQSLINGVTAFWITAIPDSTTSVVFLYPGSTAEANGNSVFSCNWQYSPGGPSSYIPTGALAVVRPLDRLTLPSFAAVNGTIGKAFAEVTSNWVSANLNQNYYTVLDVGASRPILAINGVTSNAIISDGTSTNSGSFFNGSSNNIQFLESRWYANGTYGNHVMSYINGVQSRVGFDGDLNIGTTISIGSSNTGSSNGWNGTIRNVKIYPDTTLQIQRGLDFWAPLLSDLRPTLGIGTPTYSRANSVTVDDWEGRLILVGPNEARFRGARRVKNYAPGSHFGNTLPTGWVVITSTYANNVLTATGAGGRINFGTTPVKFPGTSAMYSVEVESGNVSSMTLLLFDNTAATTRASRLINITPGRKRYYLSTDAWIPGNDLIGYIYVKDTSTANNGDFIKVYTAQVEDVTGQTIRVPSEIVSNSLNPSPFNGAGVDGIQWFTTPNPWNINTTSNLVNFSANTPSRLAWLEMPQQPGILYSFGSANGGAAANFANTTHSLLNSVTGDFTIKAYLGLRSWGDSGLGAQYTILAKRELTNGLPNYAYNFFIFSSTRRDDLAISFSTANGLVGYESSAGTGFANNTAHWVRADRFQANGSVNFWTSEDGNNWVQLGTTITNASGAGALINVAVPLQIGAVGNTVVGVGDKNYLPGKVYRVTLANTINGNPCVDFDPSRANAGAGTLVSVTGETWTIQSNTQISQNAAIRDAFVMGTVNGSNTFNKLLDGVVCEGPVINNIFFSEDLSNTTFWTQNNITLTAGSLDTYGSANGWLINKSANTVNGTIWQDCTVANDAVTRTFSLFVKKTSGSLYYPALTTLYTGGTPTFSGFVFDTNKGTTTATLGVATGALPVIREFRDFWRVSIIISNNNSNNTILRCGFHPAYNNDGSATLNTATIGTQVISAAQMEASYNNVNGEAASYVVTIAANNYTKPTDTLSYQRENWRSDEGTAYVEYRALTTTGVGRILGDTSGLAETPLYIAESFGKFVGTFSIGGINPTTTAHGNNSTLHSGIIAWSNTASDAYLFIDGQGYTRVQGYNGGIATLASDKLFIGCSSQAAYATIRNVKIWNRVLPNNVIALI